MSKQVIITCDGCGESHSATHHAGLWNRLTRKGWHKGPRVEGVFTHFCEKQHCHDIWSRLVRNIRSTPHEPK